MTSAVQYITNIDTSFPKPGQNNSSQGFRNNFSNIQKALSNLNSYMDGLAATTFNVNAPVVTATQYLNALNLLKIGNTNSVSINVIGYNDIIVTGRNSNGTKGAGNIPLLTNVIGVGRVSYGTDATYGAYFVTNTPIDQIIVGATFTNNELINFTVGRVDVAAQKIFFTPSSTNLPATVNIVNPQLGSSLAAFQNTLNNYLPIGSIILWYNSIGTIPTGWRLCDGTTYTTAGGYTYPIPDLRNKFVVGAGSDYSVHDVGGSADSIVPIHSHDIVDKQHKHVDPYAENGAGLEASGFDQVPGTGGAAGSGRTDYDQARYYTSAEFTGISGTNPAGVSPTNTNLPPYHALCYIMKVQ
jgi:microcystin-dependent protein